ncbi:imidazole glycerol phosphate synthase subunit HisH [Halobacteriales archaeon SW_5_70_135]|nr:MAG: imidazole glycerol phosphate synthase subunit HisH [Halobacteriales archaeon SW_5_70_135]
MATAREQAETAASVAVLDYGLGNLRSVTRGLERAGASVTVTDDLAALGRADGVVLPGVGAFREGVENAGPYRDRLVDLAESGTPIFGICLGMQMLLTTSEEADHAGEGEVRGLDLVPGANVRFADDLTVPHMGWNRLDVRRDHPLVDGVDGVAPEGRREDGGTVDGRYAYFVHSYYAEPTDPEAAVATTAYGGEFASVVAGTEYENVFGTQFHPEKSGETGLRILRNFVDVCAP